MGVARDVGFRMPSVWLAEGHSAVAPVYLYRFDFATPMLQAAAHRRRARHRIALRLGQSRRRPKDPTFKLGGLKAGSGGVGAHPDPMAELRRHGEPTGPPGEPEWPPYREPDRASPAHRPAGHRRRRHRYAYPRHLGQRGAQLPLAGPGLARICPGGVAVDWVKAWEQVLPPLMHDPVTFAVPFFLLLLIIEWAAAASSPTPRTERAAVGRLPEARRVGQHLDGPGLGRHQRGAERASRCSAMPRSTSTSRHGICLPPPGTRG